MVLISSILQRLTAEQKFMISVIVVNGGNYLYNLLMGRLLGPSEFADAALLITFLLVLSFIAMTFQLTVAKFSVVFEHKVFVNFMNLAYKYATVVGIVLGILVMSLSQFLKELFQTQSATMFIIFGLGVPVYFVMSVNRGIFQGKKRFEKLAITYQGEMLSRLLITLALIFLIAEQFALIIAAGIVISFVVGLYPFRKKDLDLTKKYTLAQQEKSYVTKFFVLTAFYELTQIMINNSDILLVKHYFESYEAGLYASLALIGRVVYFVAWMFVMLLLPKVVQKQKDGESHSGILFKYVGYIGMLSASIVAGCYLFPEFVVTAMFGKAYISIAPLLWKYAVATSLFAISNIFAYYFLSLDKYIPVFFSAIFGMLQVVLIVFFHDSLDTVVYVQIIAMVILLIVQILYFLKTNSLDKNKKIQEQF